MNGEENDSSEEWIPVNSSGSSSGSSVDFMEGHLSNDDDDDDNAGAADDDDDDDNMMWVTDSDWSEWEKCDISCELSFIKKGIGSEARRTRRKTVTESQIQSERYTIYTVCDLIIVVILSLIFVKQNVCIDSKNTIYKQSLNKRFGMFGMFGMFGIW